MSLSRNDFQLLSSNRFFDWSQDYLGGVKACSDVPRSFSVGISSSEYRSIWARLRLRCWDTFSFVEDEKPKLEE